MCVSGDKSKLLIMGTKALKASRKAEQILVKVDGKTVYETHSEKLLGILVNGDMTWKEHLYGEDWRIEKNEPGLLSQLSKRVGLLKKLSRLVSKAKLRVLIDGLFYSKLNYCLPVFGSVFGLDEYNDSERRYVSFTKEDNRKLQVLQNTVMRLQTGLPMLTPTATLLDKANSLSIQQLIAKNTLFMVYKIVQTPKPKYLADRLKLADRGANQRNLGKLIIPKYNLSLSREGFLSQGSLLFNKLPVSLRQEVNFHRFKSGVKKWVSENICVKPP